MSRRGLKMKDGSNFTMKLEPQDRELLNLIGEREQRSLTQVVLRALRLYEAAGRGFDEEEILRKIVGIREDA